MTAHNRPRGYTLTELVVASALVLGVGLGGLTAVQLSTRNSRVAAATQEALVSAQAMDRALQNGVGACALVPGSGTLPPQDSDIRACASWASIIRGGAVAHQRNGTLAGGTRWFMHFNRDGGAKGLVTVETRYVRDGQEVLHHVLLAPLN